MAEPFDEKRLQVVPDGAIDLLQEYLAWKTNQHLLSLAQAEGERTMHRLQGRYTELRELKEMLLRVQKGKQ